MWFENTKGEGLSLKSGNGGCRCFGRVMLELMEHVLPSSSESRSQENIEKILPMFRTSTPLFYNLSTGKNFTVRTRFQQITCGSESENLGTMTT